MTSCLAVNEARERKRARDREYMRRKRERLLNEPPKITRNNNIVVYQAVTADKYELPVHQRDTATELAVVLGVQRFSLLSAISRNCISNTTLGKCKILRLEIEVEPDDL